MTALIRRWSWPSVICVGMLLHGPVFGQSATPTVPYEADVTADSVYVRDGPGSNYNPVTKLMSGDRIQVVGDEYGWKKIVPPKGSFSYVVMESVTKVGAPKGAIQSGEIKDDTATIYAGSNLNDRKRTAQLTLKKGSRIEIIGEKDGMYKITPPVGAVLYVSAEYIKQASGESPKSGPMAPVVLPKSGDTEKPVVTPKNSDAAKAEAAKSEPVKPADTDTTSATEPQDKEPPMLPPVAIRNRTDTEQPKPEDSTTTQKPIQKTEDGATFITRDDGTRVEVRTRDSVAAERLRAMLSDRGPASDKLISLESEFRAILTKDVTRDALSEMGVQYKQITEQTAEPVAAAFAKARLDQILVRIDLLDQRDIISAEHRELDIFRRQLGEDRRLLGNARPGDLSTEPEIRGELRTSLVFSGSNKTRYRLIDPKRNGRTIAYLTIPESLEANISNLIGQYVSVKSSRRSFDSKLRVQMVVVDKITPLAGITGDATTEPAVTPPTTTEPSVAEPAASDAADKPDDAGDNQ